MCFLTCGVRKRFVVFSVFSVHLLPVEVASAVQLPLSPYDPEELSTHISKIKQFIYINIIKVLFCRYVYMWW